MFKPQEFFIEFGGDPSDDKELYKRYSTRAKPFEPAFPNAEVFCLVESHYFVSEQAKVGHLAMALQRFIKKCPCEIGGDCHCETCVARHALAASGLGDA